MKPELSPRAVVVTEDAEADPRSLKRAEAMIAAMRPGEVLRHVDDARLNTLAAERGWNHPVRWGEQAEPHDPDMVFTTFKGQLSDGERKARLEEHPNLKTHMLHGHSAWLYRGDGLPEWRKSRNTVCQPAWQLHTISGCPFRCAYCTLGNVMNVRVNIEDVVEYTEREIARLNPPQTIWKWDNQTDINCFEPEYDAVRPLVEFFARQREHYLLLYTGKSDNVDFMLDYDHQRQTIVQWSLNPRTQCERFEPKTAAWDERVESMRKCDEAGYQVRFRFSPIMPVRNWREEYTELIELIFARTKPDVAALCMFGWMDFAAAERCLDLSLWDPTFVDAMRGAAPFLTGKRYGPLPHEARAAIYRHLIDEITRVSPTTPIALCLETPQMWALFEGDLKQTADDYVCVCGPYCTPGNYKFRCREANLAFWPAARQRA